jgi:hypothetical protein
MSKDNKNEMSKDPEDETLDFPRGTSASAGLSPERTEDPSNEPQPPGAWHPTKSGAAAERQGRTTQEGAAEHAVDKTGEV